MEHKKKPEFLTLKQLREETGLSKYTITKMIKEGLPWYKFGNRKKFKKIEFDQWVEENHRIVVGNTNHHFNSLINEVLK